MQKKVETWSLRVDCSKWIQSNLIEPNAVLHMNLIMTEFSSAHVKYGVWPGPKYGSDRI